MIQRATRGLIVISIICLISGCFSGIKDGPPRYAINVNNIPNAVPQPLPRSKYGNPTSYTVDGETYHVLRSALGYNKRGIASWYGTKFQGKLTSSREPYNLFGMTAASRCLPIPCFVRVTNLENNRSVIVKVNDRGPFVDNRIIDLSYAAAAKLGYANRGTALVQVTAIDVNNPYKIARTNIPKHPRLYLQVGAFSILAHAQNLQHEIRQLTNRATRINVGRYRNKPIYRVQIGPLRGVGESDILQAKIARDGLGKAITVIS